MDFSVVIFIFLTAAAFVLETPREIGKGLIDITFSTCLLMTDYIALGGIGATLVNAAITGFNSYLFLRFAKVQPNGSSFMALWLTVGFSFFGKNIINTLPILMGVWLHARLQREPIRNFALIALLSFTLAPAVSELAFGGHTGIFAFDIFLAVFIGAVIGFIMPVLANTTIRFHNGYNLFNAGFAGGILAVFIMANFKFFGIELINHQTLSKGHNFKIALLLYTVMVLWILYGIYQEGIKSVFSNLQEMYTHTGRLVTDFYLLYGKSSFVNMGILGIIGTTLTLICGAELNGIAIAGIFTMAGFGTFGKHPKNTLPVLLGAVLAAFINPMSPTDPGNVGAILFSTGLAPIAGQFGFLWGMVAGFLHVTMNLYMGIITGGVNLYNNGFTAGFVAILLVPIILSFKNMGGKNEKEL